MQRGDEAARHPLVSISRLRILDALQAEGSLTLIELAERIGLHVNTIREHLAPLIDDGYIAVDTAPPRGRGRPRSRYRAIEGVQMRDHLRALRRLERLDRRAREASAADRDSEPPFVREPGPRTTGQRMTGPRETGLRETGPHETGPRATTPRVTTPRATTPRATTPRETGPHETGPHEIGPRETGPRETTPRETGLREARMRGAATTDQTVTRTPAREVDGLGAGSPAEHPRVREAHQRALLWQHMDEVGFEPRTPREAPDAVQLVPCVPRATADAHDRIMCRVHERLIGDLLDCVDGPLQFAALRPFTRDGGCVLLLRRNG